MSTIDSTDAARGAWESRAPLRGRVWRGANRLRSLHRDQQGTISIITVFAVMLLTMLLGMVANVGRQVDHKIKMQNAADAAAYSGGVVLARGFNTLAFTNHLLCDVFALTAFLREARDGNSASYAPLVLDAWEQVAPLFISSGFDKFERLGRAIQQKIPLERQMVESYSQWAAAVSARLLPVLEEILAEELIPRYQRAVVACFPDIAQTAACEVARRYGEQSFAGQGYRQAGGAQGPLLAALWRTTGRLVGGSEELVDPTFPVVDPAIEGTSQPRYQERARRERRSHANQYLSEWNAESLVAFDQVGKMSQFAALWRSFTCGYLRQLLEEEYPDTNLPYQIRLNAGEIADPNSHVEEYFMFVAVTYRRKLPEMMPRLFLNPLENDAMAYAQVRVYVPQSRLEWQRILPGGQRQISYGGVPGDIFVFSPDGPQEPVNDGTGRWVVGRQGVPTHWTLMNQHWSCQLVPATGPNLDVILQTPPPLPAFAEAGIKVARLGGLGNDDIVRISPH
jgi:hypothetical protein